MQRKAALLAKQWDFWRREMRVKSIVLQRLRQRADVRNWIPFLQSLVAVAGVFLCCRPLSPPVVPTLWCAPGWSPACAQEELTYALDAAGQVYIFGRGASRQFKNKARRETFRGFTKVCSVHLHRHRSVLSLPGFLLS